MRFALIALLTGTTLAAPATAFQADNGLLVQPSAADAFDVPYRGLSGADDFWCAAGDYVIRGLHLSPSTRIWRQSPPPRRSGQGIRFSLSPEGAAQSTGLAQLTPGGSLTAAHAQSLCDLPEVLID
jgi:hypothetical protein